jgi:RND family efflux transporter MFP subunit
MTHGVRSAIDARPRRVLASAPALALALALAGCGSEPTVDPDAGVDAAVDATPPASRLIVPRESLAPADVAVLVNADDPQSVAVGAHYLAARGIPAANLVSLSLGAAYAANRTTTIGAADFAGWKAAIDAATPSTIQAYAVTWIYPSVVECMSLTSALAFGFDRRWCTQPAPCATTAPSPYFATDGTTPFSTHGLRPARAAGDGAVVDSPASASIVGPSMRRVASLFSVVLHLVSAGAPGVAAVAVAACGSAAKQAPPPAPPREIEVLTMAPTEARTTGEYLGSMLSRASVNVLPQVAGYLRALHVKPGQRVLAGAPLVSIDAREPTAALASASAAADAAEARAALAVQSLRRTESMHAQGIASAQELDQARADEAAARAAVRAARATAAERQVELGYHVVRAAVPGTIGEVSARLGDYVTPTTKLTSIAGAAGLELTVGVPAGRARALADDAPIELLDADGKVLATSPAFYVAPEVDPRTQLVAVKAQFPATLGLRPAELVRARVVYATGSALQVPALAVVRQSGQAFVFVVGTREGKQVVERRAVQLGALSGKGFVVESGLAAGDRVAVSSIQLLRDGAPVTIKAPGA